MAIYPGDSNRRIGRKNENDNQVRKWYICSSIITLMFGFFMTLVVIQCSDMYLEKLEQPCKKAVFMLFSRENQGKSGKMVIS